MPDSFFGQRLPQRQPLRLAPEPDESACSFVLRVAARNLCSGNEMAGWLGLGELGDPLDMDPGPSARLLGIEAEVLARMGFEEHEAGWVLGHRVPINRLHRTMRFFCPDCLAEAPYHRRIWGLRQLDACPRHGRSLMSHCPECDAALLWRGAHRSRTAIAARGSTCPACPQLPTTAPAPGSCTCTAASRCREGDCRRSSGAFRWRRCSTCWFSWAAWTSLSRGATRTACNPGRC